MTGPVTLDETMTYWKHVADPDASGGKIFAPGVAVPAKHADTREEVVGGDGKVRMSKRIFYAEVSLSMGTYVALGDHTGAERKTVKTATAIIGSKSIPSMFGDLTRYAV